MNQKISIPNLSNKTNQGLNFVQGDFLTSEWILEKSQEPTIPQALLKDEILLPHAYKASLNLKPGILRIPTEHCSRSYLKALNLEEHLEAIYNLCVTHAQKTIEHHQANCLLAGTLAPIHPISANNTEHQKYREFSESIVFLADLGVDVFVLRSFNNLDELELACKNIRNIHNAPIAAFFDWTSAQIQILFNTQQSRIEQLQLELIGIQIPFHEMEQLQQPQIHIETFGIEISDIPVNFTKDQFAKAQQKIMNLNPSMLLAGSNVTPPTWKQFLTQLNQSDQN